jgi:hypothetical protein
MYESVSAGFSGLPLWSRPSLGRQNGGTGSCCALINFAAAVELFELKAFRSTLIRPPLEFRKCGRPSLFCVTQFIYFLVINSNISVFFTITIIIRSLQAPGG